MSERYINLKSVLLIVLFIYFYPYILTFINMGIHEIPPIFDWDLYLYLLCGAFLFVVWLIDLVVQALKDDKKKRS